MILCGLFGAILIVIGAVLGWGQYLVIYALIIIRQVCCNYYFSMLIPQCAAKVNIQRLQSD